MKKVIILGSTGSIGRQTLNVIRRHRDKFVVIGLVCGSNFELLNQQIAEFNPKFVFLDNPAYRKDVVLNNSAMLGSASEVAAEDCDIVVTGQVGVAGVLPTIAAIEAGHDIALANKETLACCGSLIISLAKKHNVKLLPVDSEHSAIWQCLRGENAKQVNKLILTASGGAFRGYSRAQLESVELKDALKHPTWNMGVKVTIDSATLMNKGLEIIEAMHLFDMQECDIDVVVHPESIIHSMVEYCDGSTIAQLSKPSMELPIQFALTYPDRMDSNVEKINWKALSQLTFLAPDTDTFTCLKIAKECASRGGLAPCIMNSANEIAVAAFIEHKIGFLDIPYYIEKTLSLIDIKDNYTLEDALNTDKLSRKITKELIESNK